MSFKKNKLTNNASASALKILLSFMFTSLMATQVVAQTVEELIAAKMSASNKNLKIDSVVQTPWKGMYEVTLKTGEVIFSDKNAEYLVVGQMLNLTENNEIVNLSEQKFQGKVAKILAEVPEKEQIVYPAHGEQKAVVTVFTDISCYYCKKLHKAIPELQKNGVTIKYMAFPRAGAGSDIAKQMNSIWCAKDKAKAMNVAKISGKIVKNNCDSPVNQQFKLGNRLGVNATPTLFTEDGVKIAGFASATNLLQDLGVK